VAIKSAGSGLFVSSEVGSDSQLPAAQRVAVAPASRWATLGAWGGYSNGNIPLRALTRVDYPGIELEAFPGSLSGLYLEPDAATAMLSLMKEYNRQTGDYLHPNEGYRTYAGQVYWKDYWTSRGQPGNAATPGTSNHGWGQAVDFNLASAGGWLAANASRFGYTHSSSEDWHYDYTGRSETVLWTSGTNESAEDCSSQTKLYPGDVRYTGSSIYSANGKYQLAIQSDGNLVHYRKSDSWPLWYTDTVGSGGYKLVMQADGNLVFYDRYDRAVWHAGTYDHPGAYLAVQCDGNLVIYWP
jgi:hypothetical protein